MQILCKRRRELDVTTVRKCAIPGIPRSACAFNPFGDQTAARQVNKQSGLGVTNRKEPAVRGIPRSSLTKSRQTRLPCRSPACSRIRITNRRTLARIQWQRRIPLSAWGHCTSIKTRPSASSNLDCKPLNMNGLRRMLVESRHGRRLVSTS